jgi:hypothetical protein
MVTSADAEVDAKNQLNYFATFGFKDAGIAKALLEKVSTLEPVEVETTEVGGQFALELPDEFGEGQPNPLKFIVVGKNEYIFASSKSQVEEFLKGASAGSTLAGSTKIESMRKLLPEKVSMISMELAPSKSMEENYKNIKENGVEDLLESIPIDEIKEFVDGIDFSKLPDYNVIKKYYSPNANYSKSNEKGSSLNYIFLKN